MKPAAVLVATFEVEIGLRVIGAEHRVRAAQHGLKRGAGVEPDIERVLDFFVVDGRGVTTRADQVFGLERLPRFNAALLNQLGDLFEQLGRARVQRAGFLVDEKWHRHAPLALAREGPIGAVGDHAVQALLAPGGEELGVLNRAQCRGAQGLSRGHAGDAGGLLHRCKPLRAGAINDRCLVPPAVHVAVIVRFALEQRASLFELLNDLRVRVPDREAAEKRQRLGVLAITHHGGEDVLVHHAVRFARVEVFDAVSGGRVDDAGAGVEGDVITEVDR